MIYYKSLTNDIYAFESDIDAANHIESGWILISETDALTVANPPLTQAQEVSKIIATIQQQLDGKAQERGYYDIKSACAYVSNVPFTGTDPASVLQEKFRVEGNALQAWMSLTWATAYTYLATVKAGTNPMPTPAEAVALMPTFTWPD
jgi:hypothetical protein